MKYDIDYNYKYEVNEYGQKLIPRDAVEKDGLIILPNGRYMPPDCYHDPKSGQTLFMSRLSSIHTMNLSRIRQLAMKTTIGKNSADLLLLTDSSTA